MSGLLSFGGRSCEKKIMVERTFTAKKHRTVGLSELVGRALDPVIARRGFATAELLAAWSDIVGARYADCSRPEKIVWPRGAANEGAPGVLIVAIEGPRALLLQHEVDQIVQRVNAFIGHGAINKVKIVQGSVKSRRAPVIQAPGPIGPREESSLAALLSGLDGEKLYAALDRLGRAVLADRDNKS